MQKLAKNKLKSIELYPDEILTPKIIKYDLKENDILKSKDLIMLLPSQFLVANSLSFQLNLHDQFIKGNMSTYIYW